MRMFLKLEFVADTIEGMTELLRNSKREKNQERKTNFYTIYGPIIVDFFFITILIFYTSFELRKWKD